MKELTAWPFPRGECRGAIRGIVVRSGRRRSSRSASTGPRILMRHSAIPVRLPAGALLAELGMSVDPELLDRALTHRSFAYERGGLPTNERLEFLGDSVLGLVVTEHLFVSYP